MSYSRGETIDEDFGGMMDGWYSRWMKMRRGEL